MSLSTVSEQKVGEGIPGVWGRPATIERPCYHRSEGSSSRPAFSGLLSSGLEESGRACAFF